MTLQKAGDGSVDGDVFNALVDDLNAGGGSQSGAVRREDLGTFTPASVLTDGPTVFTPGAGELVVGVAFSNATGLDGGSGILAAGDDASVDTDNGQNGKAFCAANGDIFDTILATVSNDEPFLATSNPVSVGFIALETDPKFLPAAPEWEALTAYSLGAYISVRHTISGSDPWTVFKATQGGTSGAAEPDWLTQPDPTDDGSVIWADVNNVASTGSVDVSLLVSAATS